MILNRLLARFGLDPQAHLSDQFLAVGDRFRKPIFIAIVLLYLIGFNGQWRPEPDAALYLSVGRNIAEGKGYSYHGEPHHLAYPGLPWLWAGVFKVAPEHALLVANALMLLMGLACLPLCYRLFWLFTGRAMAVWMTLGLAISRMFYRYTFELRSDVPFLLGVLAFLCGFEAIAYASRRTDGDDDQPYRARWYDWALMIGGLAIVVVMRPTMWAVLGAAAFATLRLLFIRRTLGIVVGLMLVIAVVVGSFSLRSQYEEAVLAAAQQGEYMLRLVFNENLPGLFEPAAAEALFGLDLGLGLNTLMSLVAIGVGLSLFRYRLIWGLLYLFTILIMLAVLPRDRYFLPVLPLIVFGWWKFLVWIERKLPDRWGRYAFLLLFFVGSATNVAKIASQIGEQHNRPFYTKFERGKWLDFPELSRTINETVPPNGWLLSPPRFDRIFTFYSDRNVTNPTEIAPQEMQVLANVKRAYVLNPQDPKIVDWITGSDLRVGDAVYTIGDDVRGRWSLHPINPQPGTTFSNEAAKP